MHVLQRSDSALPSSTSLQTDKKIEYIATLYNCACSTKRWLTYKIRICQDNRTACTSYRLTRFFNIQSLRLIWMYSILEEDRLHNNKRKSSAIYRCNRRGKKTKNRRSYAHEYISLLYPPILWILKGLRISRLQWKISARETSTFNGFHWFQAGFAGVLVLHCWPTFSIIKFRIF